MTSSVDAIVEELYAGTLDDEAWKRAILKIIDSVSGSGAMLMAFNPATGILLRNECHRFDPRIAREYRGYWDMSDIRVPAGMRLPVGQPVYEAALFPLSHWKRCEVYNDFLLPNDCPYFLAAWLHKSSDKLVALSIQGSVHRGPFDATDACRFTPVLPHLRRAIEIRDRLHANQVRAESLAQAMGRFTFGVMVLDAVGRVLEANPHADHIFKTQSVLRRMPDGQLVAAEPADRELKRWIHGSAASDTPPNSLIHVTRPNGHLPLSVMVTPLPAEMTGWTCALPRWLVLVFDPENGLDPRIDLLTKDLGISAREAEVAALLTMGYRVTDVARRLGVSVHTVRSQVKTIFSKTGLQSQSDLVRRVLSGPAMHGGPALGA